MISWAVVGHTERLVYATDLARLVGGVVTVDDGSAGADRNHLKAWDITCTAESEWAVVLEDDAIPVPGFLEQATQALTVAPADVVSLYLGRSRPRRWQDQITRATGKAADRGACWILSTHLLHAVAVAIRTDLREDWLDWAHDHDLPIDQRLSAWCLAREHKVAYTWPSLVDHRDETSLIPPNRSRRDCGPRIAWRTGTRAHWDSRAVMM